MAFAVILWFIVGDRQPPPAVQPVERLDPKAASEIRGGDVVQVKGAKRDIRVEFGSQILYTDGRMKYTSFKAYIDDRGGRSFELTGNEAYVGSELSTYDVRGNVALKTSDGLTAKTPVATFTEAEGVVHGAGAVDFQRGRVSGSAVGFSYDRSLDRLSLLDKADVKVAPDAGGGGAMHVTAGAAGYSRKERYMRFERVMRMERQGQVIEAETATVFLLRNRDEPETVELRGSSRITGATGTGSLQGMQARDINLRYAPDGRTLQQAQLAGQSAIQLGRADGTPGQRAEADTIEAGLATDGSLTHLAARDNVRVTLPAGGKTGPRTVTALILNAVGEQGRGLTSMSFDGGTEYREEAASGGRPRILRAPSLKAAMDASASITAAEFAGGFRLEDGPLSATSATANYDVTDGTLRLASTGPPVPHLADERVSLDAAAIDVTLSPRRLTASGAVRAQFAAGRREGERGTTLLSPSEPILVASDKFEFEEASGKGSYSGGARLWQHKSGTEIRADTIALDEKLGTLKANGNVLSTLPIASGPDEGAKATSIARAGSFEFDDAKRRAVFETQAQLDGVQGNVHARLIEVFLAPKDNTLQRLEARDAVEVVIEKRKATGQRMTYHPDDARYVLTGSPVRLLQECQESTGRTLTFWKSSDRIQVDGADEIRTQTKGGKCPDAPKAGPPF